MSDQPQRPDQAQQPDQPQQPDRAKPADRSEQQPEAVEPVESAEPAEPVEPVEPVVGWLPRPASEIFGAGATAELAYDLLTVDVPVDGWLTALTAARDDLGCRYFDWLSAVDEPGTGFRICAHLADVARPGTVHRLVVRTTVPHDAAALPTAVGVYAGAGWHERETHEMFGVDFTGHPHLVPLLLPEGFEGHPLRKDFVLAARVAKAWPGAKEPGESEHGGPKRRQMLPPGVPDPNEWGPLKGQLPPAPARPARGARAAGGAAGERPARRTRSVSAGSASQQAAQAASSGASAAPEAPAAPARAERPARRTRSASQGSASQQQPAEKGAPPATTEPSATTEAPAAPAAPRSSDAPWHHARPAFDEPQKQAEPKRESEAEPEPEPQAEPEPQQKPEPTPEAKPQTHDPAGGDTP
ncbi:NADH-quinone oxidoreductase subunit C [Streptomyces bugieae]|uniref:NADH-quinone oxidoreductase subunit C n=1 Tax=Streptomyces bugieae TaxID=3098223 RepID=A0ABU7NY30_9ACTN|nr:NADH-quinone oxidoreductase subunit C [Streptomyces sp. DSM 41528]